MTSPFLVPERDPAFKRGRPKQGGTTYLTIPGFHPTTIGVGSGQFSADSDYYFPLFVETPIIVTALVAEVTTLESGKNFRMGLYRRDTSWQPIGAPLADSGDISTTTTGVKTYTPGTPIYLARGGYLGVFNTNYTGTADWRVIRGDPPGGFLGASLGGTARIITAYVSRAYAAFPTPGTAWNSTDNSTTGVAVPVFLQVGTP